jgi:hypothetical protein
MADEAKLETQINSSSFGDEQTDNARWIKFPCTVENKTDEYIDVKYSRNDDRTGEPDLNYYAISRFTADQVKNFAKVTDKAKSLEIEHAALTDELLKYEQNKRAVE